MSGKFAIQPKNMPDGSMEFEIKPNDTSVIGKKATFSIFRKVSVKNSRPVNDSKILFDTDFIVSTNHKIIAPYAIMQKLSGSFPYSGPKIKIQTFAEVKVSSLIFSDSISRFVMSNHTSSKVPQRAKVKNNAKELIDPKDTFKFFKNLGSIPDENKIATILLLGFGGGLMILNFLIGCHDQFVPEHLTWVYSHYDSDGEGESPLINSLMGCAVIGITIWAGMRKQLQKYMTFHFRSRISNVNRESTVNVSKLITGRSRVDLINPVLRIVVCNIERGQYLRGYGSEQRTISFNHPNRAVLLYSRCIRFIPKNTPIHKYFDEEFSFEPVFQALYPKQMVSRTHGLDLVWEVQLVIGDLVDQELVGNPKAFIQEEFYKS